MSDQSVVLSICKKVLPEEAVRNTKHSFGAKAQVVGVCRWVCSVYFLLLSTSGYGAHGFSNRGQKSHINFWHINNFSVTPITDPSGRVPGRKCYPNQWCRSARQIFFVFFGCFKFWGPKTPNTLETETIKRGRTNS